MLTGTYLAAGLAAGRVSSDPSIGSIVFLGLFAVVGVLLAFNIKDAADRFADLVARASLGIFAGFGPGIYRVVGAGIAFLGCAGVTAELVVAFT
ncbi:hypothetical protein [Streptomyces erythrochromogenes]|uniref:hypothetical protein n=1 Tax=Streptomyces erythrochromogenes TaxID=285574 RepID=UPI0036786C90